MIDSLTIPMPGTISPTLGESVVEWEQPSAADDIDAILSHAEKGLGVAAHDSTKKLAKEAFEALSKRKLPTKSWSQQIATDITSAAD
ncbi:MAG TPA: hypothetical protein VGR35_01245 [Tepidisphaeraceae bacterium]|nr:hypothetical protein [Tepidisphaeraceae bacterium]